MSLFRPFLGALLVLAAFGAQAGSRSCETALGLPPMGNKGVEREILIDENLMAVLEPVDSSLEWDNASLKRRVAIFLEDTVGVYHESGEFPFRFKSKLKVNIPFPVKIFGKSYRRGVHHLNLLPHIRGMHLEQVRYGSPYLLEVLFRPRSNSELSASEAFFSVKTLMWLLDLNSTSAHMHIVRDYPKKAFAKNKDLAVLAQVELFVRANLWLNLEAISRGAVIYPRGGNHHDHLSGLSSNVVRSLGKSLSHHGSRGLPESRSIDFKFYFVGYRPNSVYESKNGGSKARGLHGIELRYIPLESEGREKIKAGIDELEAQFSGLTKGNYIPEVLAWWNRVSEGPGFSLADFDWAKLWATSADLEGLENNRDVMAAGLGVYFIYYDWSNFIYFHDKLDLLQRIGEAQVRAQNKLKKITSGSKRNITSRTQKLVQSFIEDSGLLAALR